MPLHRVPSLVHPGYKAGRSYSTWPGPIATSGAVAAIDTIYFYPFLLPAPVTVTAFQVRVNVAGAGSSMKSGIWADSPVSDRPLGAPLLADNVGVSTAATGNVAPAATGSLSPGVYWIGTKFTGTLPTMVSASLSSTYLTWLTGNVGSGLSFNALTVASAFASDMPTFAEGASFTIASVVVPLVALTT